MSHGWRAIAATVTAFSLGWGALAPVAGAAERVGVAGAATPVSTGTAPGGGTRTLEVGRDVHFREVIRTSDSGAVQIMFLDRSAFNVGPNSEVTIDEFVYDPATGAGKIAARATVGVMRFVGGRLSKNGQVTIQTPTATLGIRGGIMLVEVDRGGATRATFLYGQQMSVTSLTGATQVVRQVGYQVSVPSVVAPPTTPARVPPQQLTGQMAATEPPAPATPAGPATGALQPQAGMSPSAAQLAPLAGATAPGSGIGTAQGTLPGATGRTTAGQGSAAPGNVGQTRSGQANAGQSTAAQASVSAATATAGAPESPFSQRVNAALSPQSGRVTPAFAPTLRPVAGVRPPTGAGLVNASTTPSTTGAPAAPAKLPAGAGALGSGVLGSGALGTGALGAGAMGDVTRNVVNLAPRGGQTLPPRTATTTTFPKGSTPVAPGRMTTVPVADDDAGRRPPRRLTPPVRPVVRPPAPVVAPTVVAPISRPGTPRAATGAPAVNAQAPALDAALAAQAAARAAEMIQRSGIGRAAAEATRRSSAARAPAAASSAAPSAPSSSPR